MCECKTDNITLAKQSGVTVIKHMKKVNSKNFKIN